MTTFERIKDHWMKCLANEWGNNPWMIRLQKGDLDLCHYQGFLLETYHNTARNPQIQGYATLYFPGNPRPTVKRFLQHAISEIAHDLLAMNDLMALGVDKEFILKSKPLAITDAFFANAVWGIQRFGPAYYLGYLFHLEFGPTEHGHRNIEVLKKKGIPSEAMTFLEEHSVVDIGHNKFMEQYVTELVTDEKQLQTVLDSITANTDLHTRVLSASFENGEKLFGPQAIKMGSSF